MKFVLLSDMHFVPNGQPLYGLSPQDRFAACIDVINRDHPDIDFILVAGDLAHHGEVAAYHSVAKSLSEFKKPVHLMLGNHDNREVFFDVFSKAARDENGYAQFTIEDSDHVLICLDTLKQGAREGELCAARLEWLKAQLQKRPAEKHLTIVMHHPPFDLGIPTMDLIRMKDDQPFVAVLDQYGWPDQFIFGHVHRPINGTWRGVPFHIQRAINHQVSLNFSDRDWIQGTDELPDYSVIRASREQFLIFTRGFSPNKRRFDLSPPEATRALISES